MTEASLTTDRDEPIGGAAGPQDEAVIVRREEQPRLGTERLRYPIERVRLVRHIVTEQVTQVVERRREELRVERVPVVDGTPADAVAAPGPLEMVLHEEEVVITTRVVPRERVRVLIEQVDGGVAQVDVQLAREQIEVSTSDVPDTGGVPRSI